MKNERDEINIKDPLVDLFYPSKEKRNAAKKRAAARKTLPADLVADLKLEALAGALSSYYSNRTLELLSELCDDPEVINYRLDVLEDFMNIPKLSATVKKTVNIMIENDRKNIYKLSTPDSFSMLSEAIEAFEAYIECMEILHAFYIETKDKIRSQGVRKMFEYFEEQFESEHFKALKKECSELRDTVRGRIRSVTVAINLDEYLVPVSAGILSLSREPYILKPSLLDRVIYHGANFQSPGKVGSIKNKYSGRNIEGGQTVNVADKALFDELEYLSAGYVEKLCDVLEEYQKITLKDMYAISAQLDFYLGAIDMKELAESSGLRMCRPVVSREGETEIKGIFDPIYFREARVYNMKNKQTRKVVTNDHSFGKGADFYILTGANNGGKTTFVRAVGICFAMAQAGLYVPAESCRLRLSDHIYTHFPREEQTGIDASRFTTEIKQFKAISETITDRSLLLMNESVQSTTPRECVDIASEIVRIFCKIGVRGIFATHLTEIAAKVPELNAEDPVSKLESIIVLTDEKTGERQYKVVKGKPAESSFAKQLLGQFGIDSETIVRSAKERAKKV